MNPLGIKLGLVAALLSGLGMLGAGLYGYSKGKKADRQRSDLVIAQMQADSNATALAASEAYRRLEQEAAAKVKGAQDALDKERKNATRIAADLRTERERANGLRDQIAAFASGGGPAAEDSISACRDRSNKLGDLLERSVRVQESLASGAESEASNVRALLESCGSD